VVHAHIILSGCEFVHHNKQFFAIFVCCDKQKPEKWVAPVGGAGGRRWGEASAGDGA
jgi:hypothetical protein